MARKSYTREIEPWFQRNGLPWFVPEERQRARDALRPRRAAPVLLVVVLAAVAAAVGLTWLTGQGSYAPASLTLVAVIAAIVYFVTALRARPIVAWALRRTVHSSRQLLPMATRALPLLLLFVTFLFINAEVWQLSAQLDGSVMWLTVLLFTTMAVGFLLVRLPEEVDRVDDALDEGLLRRATRGTPIEGATWELLDREEPLRLERYGEVPGWERRNLILVLLVTQIAQVFLLSLSVFAFFMVFGGIVMERGVQEAWAGGPAEIHALPYVSNLSVELVQVSVFLAVFSGLYFTVGVLTDEHYREQFFAEVLGELERAVGVRAAYLALRERAGEEVGDSLAPQEATTVAEGASEQVQRHWSFRQIRPEEIGDGPQSGELLLLADGRLFCRYGGASHRDGSTRWDFGPWRTFAGWPRETEPERVRELLEQRGYELFGPGPLAVGERAGGPFPGPPPQRDPA